MLLIYNSFFGSDSLKEDLKFGIGTTAIICCLGWLIGGVNALFVCVVFCSIPWAYEINEMINGKPVKLETCILCGSKFKIRNKTMEFEYRTVGLCPICIESIFQYSKTVPEIE